MKSKLLKVENILVFAGILWLAYNICATPYSPCHDSLDLHTILSYMLRSEQLEILDQAYINFWINNKLTIYCYLPFVRLFQSVSAGVRTANGIFLISGVIFTAVSADKMSNKRCFPFAFFIISLLAPFMLLTGPYIYLPSLFIASAALMCLTLRKKFGYAVFVTLSALLFVLRPTCAGFILTFLTVIALLNIKNRRYCFTHLLLVVCIFVFGTAGKSFIGNLLYKSGVHIYPNMQNSALLWTIELGTRPNGNDTGSCTYNPYAIPENYDKIQRDFHHLWMYYYNDVLYKKSSYGGIKIMQEKIWSQIKKRTYNLGLKGMLKNIIYKTKRFYENDYLPYYYKANVNDKNLKLGKNYEKKYFAYMNFILMLFFISIMINLFVLIKQKKVKNKYALAAAAASLSVNVLMIALTEVSKKYLFDFFTPMVLCIYITCSYVRAKTPKANTAVAITVLTAVILLDKLYNIQPFYNADTSLTIDNGSCVYEIKMPVPCLDARYYLKQHDGKIIIPYGKKNISLTFPYDCFDAFALHTPDGTIKEFSSQPIE